MISVVKLLLLALTAVPLWASAFTCKILSTGQMVQTGSANLYVNLTPQIGIGQNLIVDLTQEIKCKNDSAPPDIDVDHLKLLSGSAYQGALDNFSGAVYWVGKYYPIPLTANTPYYSISNTSYAPLPLKLYLTPLGAAGGKLIRSGELIAVLSVYKIATFDGGYPTTFTWNIYANNDVVLPTGGCDVSSRDVTVTLPDYPASIKVPVNIHCAQSQRLGYSLSGATADAARGAGRAGKSAGFAGNGRHRAGRSWPDRRLCAHRRAGHCRKCSVNRRGDVRLSVGQANFSCSGTVQAPVRRRNRAFSAEGFL